MALGWLEDGTERSLRSALASVDPSLAALPLVVTPWCESSDPLWWSSSAVVDGRFVVKYAWSEVRAERLWREGVVLQRLRARHPFLPVPEVVVARRRPALLMTRLVAGVPLSWEWAGRFTGGQTGEVARQLAAFLARLHDGEIARLVGDLPVVEPTPQADTGGLRSRFSRLVDDRRAASVMRWCDWVDEVLGAAGPGAVGVLVHGDLHGHNQVWDGGTSTLLAVVDFEESGIADPHYDLRYVPAYAPDLDLLLAVVDAYEHASGRSLALERVMAWHVLTALGDALWRTEAGVALPDGGTATTYVDDLAVRLRSLGLD